jgi:hypothetical protein
MHSCWTQAAVLALWMSGCESTVTTSSRDKRSDSGNATTTGSKSRSKTDAGTPSSMSIAAAGGLAPQVEIIPPNGERCDGRDNDDNGRIDDADVENDGVCDCLKLASIGRPGAYGEGDLQFRTWPNAMAQNHVVSLEGAELTDKLLADIDVLIVLNVSTVADVAGERPHHAFTDQEVESLARWVRAGGGVFTTSGYSGEVDTEVVNVNKLLAPFKLAYSPSKYGLNGIVADWTKHPVTDGVQRVYIEVGAQPDGTEALTLAKDATEHVALQVPTDAAAKVIVWGDEWITYASQWQAESNQQVERFWVNAITWLSRDSSCQHRL